MTHHPLVIGCPVWHREWAIPHWFRAAEMAAWRAGAEPAYVFVADESDEYTVELIRAHCEEAKRTVFFHWVKEPADTPTKRIWNSDRYYHMVDLRNTLLELVRDLTPAFFLSLDSDIFLHQQALVNMMEHVDEFAAIGGKTYMTPDSNVAPSYCMMSGSSLKRPDSFQVLPDVDAIMAIKLMTPAAYRIDYRHHDKGEDLGWSQAVREAGYRLCWDGRVASKHAMKPSMVDVVDPRCGF